ncbi:MAG: NAD(P)/FAD-dependent oxidoreductase [Propioniciclava sp.]
MAVTTTSGDAPGDQAARWDVVVLGGGVAGLSAALMLGRSRRRTLVIDAGRPRNRFAGHMRGVLGQEGLPPADLLRRGRAEAADYGVTFLDDEAVTVVDDADSLVVPLASGEAVRTRTLVLATGLTDELPPIPGLAEQWGVGVLHCPYCHGWELRDQRLGVLATSAVALHQVPLIRQLSQDVVLFSAAIEPLAADQARRLVARGVRVVSAAVEAVLSDGDRLRGVRTTDGTLTEVDAVFTMGALRPQDQAVAGLGLERVDQPFGLGSFIGVDGMGKTSHARIWAAGNVVAPGANVPVAIGAGSLTGPAVNAWLAEEDGNRALAAAQN